MGARKRLVACKVHVRAAAPLFVLGHQFEDNFACEHEAGVALDVPARHKTPAPPRYLVLPADGHARCNLLQKGIVHPRTSG